MGNPGWKEMNRAIRAYLLGFILADGHIFKRKWDTGLRVEVCRKDEAILEIINEFLGNRTRISRRPNRNSSYLSIKGKEIYNYLKPYFDRRDSGELFPIANGLSRYVALGLSDGDGCIFISHNAVGWFLVAQSEEFIVNFYNWVRVASGVDFMSPLRNKQNLWVLKVHGNIKANKFLSWLYKDTKLGLPRKRKIWEDHNG